MARGFGSAVHREMLRGGDHLVVLRIVSLQPFDESHGQPPGERRIFAVGFLAASPPGIAKNVDVGRPEGEAVVLRVVILAERLVILRARFGRDRVGDSKHQIGVPRGCQADRLRKHRGLPRPRHPVQRLVPPVVGGHAKLWNRRRVVLHLPDLLIQRHPVHQIGRPHVRSEAWIEIRRPLLPHRGHCGTDCGDQNQSVSAHGRSLPRLPVPGFWVPEVPGEPADASRSGGPDQVPPAARSSGLFGFCWSESLNVLTSGRSARAPQRRLR